MLTYGLKRGTKDVLMHIDSVPNGSKCGCVCPHCGEDLEACQGEIRQHFFRHASGAECSGARMTTLHMLAQKVLHETSEVMLPAYEGEYVRHNAKIVKFDRVKLEVPCKDEQSRLRPDCICYNDKKESNIWVEIFCTNPLDDLKKADIVRRKQYCIEIDFSDLLNTDYTKDIVRERLLDPSYGKWICCPAWEKEDEDEQMKAEKRGSEFQQKRQEIIREAQDKYEKVLRSKEGILSESFSHFILYPNGEATLTQIEGDINVDGMNIKPQSDSLYEAVINARADFYTYHYCYLQAQNEAYHYKDCRTCQNRKYDGDGKNFNERDIGLFCKYSKDLEERFLPPQFAITCKNYIYDKSIPYTPNSKVKLIRIK